MALKSRVLKAHLNISDLDRNYYHDHQFTLAQHPSETDERLMIRILTFAIFAQDSLLFGKGVGDNDEPALWQKDLSGSTQLWIEVGLPDERRIRKACGVSTQVMIIAYGATGAVDFWWEQNKKELTKLTKVTIIQIPQEASQAIAKFADRNMQLSCTIEAGQIYFMNETQTVEITPKYLQRN